MFPKREFSEFLEDQKKYKEDANLSLSKLIDEAKQKELSCCRNKPYISERSKEITKSNERNACERLYYTKTPIKNSSNDFTPPKKKELSKDELELVNRLHADAQTRKSNLEKLRHPISIPKKECSKATEYYLRNKFNKEFTNCLNNLKIQSDACITFEKMKDIMKGMGFKQHGTSVNKYFEEIFNTLQEQNLVNVELLKRFIAGILDVSLNSNTTRIDDKYKALYLIRNTYENKQSIKSKKSPTKNLSKSFLEFEEHMKEHLRKKEEKLIKKRTELELKELEACTFNSINNGNKKRIRANTRKRTVASKVKQVESIDEAVNKINKLAQGYNNT